MSARAAWRLESMGFQRVYRYEPGKADWMANGLPIEGRQSDVVHVSDVVRRDVPICGPDARIAEARERARAAGWDDCVVVNDAGVVLGILRRHALDGDASALVADVMDPGPSTYQPDVLAEELVHRLRDRDLTARAGDDERRRARRYVLRRRRHRRTAGDTRRGSAVSPQEHVRSSPVGRCRTDPAACAVRHSIGHDT